MHIRSVHLRDFFGFRDFTIDFDHRLSVIVGLNNAGKTSLLRCLSMCLECIAATATKEARKGAFGARGQSGYLIDNIASHAPRMHLANHAMFVRAGGGPATCGITIDHKRGGFTVLYRIEFDAAKGTTKCDAVIHEDDSEFEGDLFPDMNRFRGVLLSNLGEVTAQEKAAPWFHVQQQRMATPPGTAIRNEINWLYEGTRPEEQQRVDDVLAEFLPEVRLVPPQRSKDENDNIQIDVIEDDVAIDVSAVGGGLKNLLQLIITLELSSAPFVLLDEPEAHLHPSLQRRLASYLEAAADEERQIIVATHSPDFIGELPLDSLIWIDRRRAACDKCDEVGKTLVDLGACSHAYALQSLGADMVLFVEGAADQHVFKELFARCGADKLAGKMRLVRLDGFGDVEKLPRVKRLLARASHAEVAIGALLDADYSKDAECGVVSNEKGVPIARLPVKELENLLLCDLKAVLSAIQERAKQREVFTGSPVDVPSLEKVQMKLREILEEDDIREAVERNFSSTSEDDSKFAARWADPEWRLRHCPGKEVFKRLVTWVQREYKLAIRTRTCFKQFEPSAELSELLKGLQAKLLATKS